MPPIYFSGRPPRKDALYHRNQCSLYICAKGPDSFQGQRRPATVRAPAVTRGGPTRCTPLTWVQISMSVTGEEPGLWVFQPVRVKVELPLASCSPSLNAVSGTTRAPSGDQSSTPWPYTNSSFLVSHWSWLFLTRGFLDL